MLIELDKKMFVGIIAALAYNLLEVFCKVKYDNPGLKECS